MSKNTLLNYFSLEELEKIKKQDNLYLKADTIVQELFKYKADKAGKPYLGHLYRVSNKLNDPLEKVAALLHDTVEDTDVTFEDLLDVGFPYEILKIVKLVTKDKIDKSNMSDEEILKLYNDKIINIISSGNMHAIRLKEADISDNYSKDRLKELPLEKQEWFEKKYGKQLVKLRKVIDNNDRY